MQVAFEGEIIHTQYCIENKRFDDYLPKYKRGIEVDEYHYPYRDAEYERSKQLMIESHELTVIRTNPEASNCINRLLNQIYMHIIKSTKNQAKKSSEKTLINVLPKRLLELEFKSNHSTKSKCLKWIVKKILPDYKE